jgi:radical SAM protein with 4Fe4S-binding SPASM domain
MDEERKQELLTESKTFCMMPFVHMYLNTDGNVLPCCTAQYTHPVGNVRTHTIKEIWNNKEYKEIRRKIVNKEPVDHCKNCYMHEVESDGKNSFRRWANEDFKQFVDVVDFMEPDGTMLEMPLKYFDIRFSNICNYKCRTCGDIFSTSWAQENMKAWAKNTRKNYTISIHVSNNDPSLLEQFKPYLPDMHIVYFAGGEPLITPEHYEVLEYLIEQKSTKMLLRYNSNMSVLGYKDKNILDMWKHFDKIDLFASLDSWGDRAAYIRHGTNWTVVVDNLKKIKEQAPNVSVQFNCVVSLFNIATITDFLDELIAEGLFDPYKDRPTLYRAITPPELCMRVLDDKTKKAAEEKILAWIAKFPVTPKTIANALKENIAYLQEDHSHLKKMSKALIDAIDSRRGESFVNTFPELKEWYDSI